MRVIPLHLHSYWSLLAGLASVRELVEAAQAQRLPALALTDHNALYGAVEFAWRCRAAGVRPLIGAELALRGGGTAVLLAQDARGYASLCRLITRLQAAPDREAALRRGLPAEALAEAAQGLVCLAADPPGEWREAFGDRLFVELQRVQQDDDQRVADAYARAHAQGLPVVATHDVRYLSPADAPAYCVVAAMRAGKRLDDLTCLPDLSWPSEEDMRRRFAAYPDALENTARVAELCAFDMPVGRLQFPALALPAGRSARDEMWARVLDGAANRYGTLTPRVAARLEKETGIIDALGYTPYFLVVADIVAYARAQRVPVSPRGSASSSVVAYCLGIHDVDPLEHDLYFERFLSLERHDPPDIDLDLCSRRRDEVIDYVYRKYGADHVAMVCTYATLRPRSALREVGKAYGLPEARIKALSKELPWFWHPGMRADVAQAQARLLAQARDETESEVIAMARALDGTPHHLSVHPGGIVIAPGPITDLVPLQHATKGLLITQYDLSGIEKLGLVKIDLLGISALTVMADCVEMVQRREAGFTLESIPAADETTARMLSRGHTIGCFQIESPGMRLTLRELAAHNARDLLVALALYRPGPLKGGLKDAFVRRHLGQEQPQYAHPALEPVLGETYGVILYQEQVLRVAHEVAGFSLGEADRLRRAMSKFRSAHEMARLHEQFVEGALRTSGLEAPVAEEVWEHMAAFAGYGFPKAHAAGYAALSYRAAYLKTHHPAEFMAARLATWGGFYRPQAYLREAQHLGLDVRPPHVNHSAEAFALDADGRTLWMGLGQVRELTHVTIRAILARRPFDSLEDFLVRAEPLQAEAINLVRAGALAGLGDAQAMLARLEGEPWHGRHTAQLNFGLRTANGELAAPAPATAAANPQSALRHAQFLWEQEVLGVYVSVHPVELAAWRLRGRIRSTELAAHAGREVLLAGVRLAAHRFHPKGQEPRLLADMDDESGAYQVLWSGAALREYRALLAHKGPVLVRGRVSRDRQGEALVVGSEVAELH